MATDATKADVNDWTAGIVVIVAAVLLGAALPIGLWFGLHEPQSQELAKWEEQATNNKNAYEVELVRQKKVKETEHEGDQMKAALDEIEAHFTPASKGFELIKSLNEIAKNHKLELPEDKKFSNEKIVKPVEQNTALPKGLGGSKIMVDCRATYADFGRFMAELENLPTTTLISGNLIASGDANGGDRHSFHVEFYVIQKREGVR